MWIGLGAVAVITTIALAASDGDDEAPRPMNDVRRLEAVWPRYERDICLTYLDAVDAGVTRLAAIDAAVNRMTDLSPAAEQRLRDLIADCG
jgi:hypothetical protein